MFLCIKSGIVAFCVSILKTWVLAHKTHTPTSAWLVLKIVNEWMNEWSNQSANEWKQNGESGLVAVKNGISLGQTEKNFKYQNTFKIGCSEEDLQAIFISTFVNKGSSLIISKLIKLISFQV